MVRFKGHLSFELVAPWCSDLQHTLTVYTRGAELALFQFYHEPLYYSVVVPGLKTRVCLAQRVYPCTDLVPGVVLTISHKTWDTLNTSLEDIDIATTYVVVVPLRGQCWAQPTSPTR